MHASETSFLMLGDGLMITLILMFTLMLIYVVERSIFLHVGNIKPQQFLAGITALLDNNRYNEAVTICEETHGFVANVIKISLFFSEKNSNQINYAVKNFVLSVIPTLERRLNSISLIGKISPAIGCIGSCIIFSHFISSMPADLGYMQSTQVFTLIKNVLTMISFSLFVNVCAATAYAFLRGRVRKIIYNMEWSYMEITNFLSCKKAK